MKKFLVIALISTMLFSMCNFVYASDYSPQRKIYLVAEDAGVDGTNAERADMNYGASNNLTYRANGSRYPYFKFDLTEIQQYSQHLEVKSVILQITTIGALSSGTPTTSETKARVYYVEDDSWVEGTERSISLPDQPSSVGLTFNNRPAGSHFVSDEVEVPVGTTSMDMHFDITSAVLEELEKGDTVFSCMLDFDKYFSQTITLYSKENGANKGARLIVEYDMRPVVSFENTVFSKNESTILSLEDGEIECETELKNISEAAITPVVFFGLYCYDEQQNALQLKGFHYESGKTIPPQQAQKYDASFLVDETTGHYIKIWAANSITDVSPYNSYVYFDAEGMQNTVAPTSYPNSEDAPLLQDVKFDINRDSGVMSVSGSVSTTRNKPISVLVYDFSADLSNLKAEDVVFADILYPQEDEKFHISFVNNEQVNSKKYSLHVKSQESDQNVQLSLKYYKTTILESFLNEINSFESAEVILNVIDEYLDFSERELKYYDLEFDEKVEIAESFISERPKDGFESVEDAIAQVQKHIILHNINRFSAECDFESMSLILNNEKALFDIPQDIWEAYSQLESVKQDRDNVLGLFCESVIKKGLDVKSHFVDSVIIHQITNSINHSSLKYYITEKFSDYINLSSTALATYKKINIVSDVYKLMIEDVKNVKTIGDIANLFESACTKVYENERAKKSSAAPAVKSGGGRTYNLDPNLVQDAKEAPVPADVAFSDVSREDWSYEAIRHLKDKGVVTGNHLNLFEPKKPVTRAEFVKMISIAFKLDSESEKHEFKDLSADNWAYPYICTAIQQGIIYGYGNGYVGANDSIRRQDMALIMYRVLELKEIEISTDSALPDFKDKNQISDYALDAVAMLSGRQIIKGNDANEFQPNAATTREEAAKVIFELLKLMEK
ncbi:MAG: S-layer homology domain-containing protein [Eubacteriales bacterium]|nr:S-layer homology domain-containing protein [Eubacteriales bacterium]